MAATERDAERLLALSDDELYLGLGREVVGAEGVPQDLGAIVNRGKAAFNEFRTRLRPALCGTGGPKKGLEELSATTLVTTIATAALAGNVAGIGAAAAMYVAVLIVRMGLDKYCEGYVPLSPPAAASGASSE